MISFFVEKDSFSRVWPSERPMSGVIRLDHSVHRLRDIRNKSVIRGSTRTSTRIIADGIQARTCQGCGSGSTSHARTAALKIKKVLGVEKKV